MCLGRDSCTQAKPKAAVLFKVDTLLLYSLRRADILAFDHVLMVPAGSFEGDEARNRCSIIRLMFV